MHDTMTTDCRRGARGLAVEALDPFDPVGVALVIGVRRRDQV